MALNPTTVGNAIAALVAGSAPPPGTEITELELEAMWRGIAGLLFGTPGGVAAATVTVSVTSVAGVTPGGGVSGPGAGTAVIS